MSNYDVFISYRNTDDNGHTTKDAAMAESLYFALREKGYNPFFSKYSISNDGRSDYVTLINEALESSKNFIAIGTSRKNLDSKWVKHETNTFIALMNGSEEETRTLLSYRSKDFPEEELPTSFKAYQSYTDEEAVVRFIDVILNNASSFRKDGDCTQLLYENEFHSSKSSTTTSRDSNSNGLKPSYEVNNRYIILSEIGRGGISVVYLALDKHTNRSYAIKAIKKETSVNPSIFSSILAETNLMKWLNHHAIPRIVDIIDTADSCLIVMDYVEGHTLNKLLLESGIQDESFVIDIAKQLADVLDHLHSRPDPIIYRDLKPANIMLQPDGKIKLVDFGTARQYKPNAIQDTVNLGTIGYAAPEQYGGMGQTDPRTDIYALGVTLYNLVTGKNPAEPPYEILPIRQVNPELSFGLEYIIQKCTQKDPENRFQSAKEVLDALENIDKLKKRTSLFSSFKLKSKKNEQQQKSPFVESNKTPTNFASVVPTSPLEARSNTNPELEATISKLVALDTESQQIVINLINKLSK